MLGDGDWVIFPFLAGFFLLSGYLAAIQWYWGFAPLVVCAILIGAVSLLDATSLGRGAKR